MQAKFMQSLDPTVYAELEKIAKDRGITIQELMRAVVVPEWFRSFNSNGNISSLQRTA